MTLHHAALTGNLEEIQRLITAGADVDGRDDDGRTPLMIACESPEAGVDVVEFFLDHGADLHASAMPKPVEQPALVGSEEDLTAMLKNSGMSEEMLEFMKKFRSEPPPEPDRPAPIKLAVTGGDLRKIQLLIERGADVFHRSNHGYTLLTTAACANRMEVVDFLLEAGAPVDGESSYRESALSVLSRNGRFEHVRKVLAHGADPSPLEWNELHRAIALGTLGEMESLIAAGADLEAKDGWGRTAFLLSLQTGDIGKATSLLAHGADRNATGRIGKLPMEYAIDGDDARMLGWLIEQGFDLNQIDPQGHPLLYEAINHDAVGCFRLLIEAGADWKWVGEYGFGLMHECSHPEIIRMLVDLGDDAGKLEAEPLRKWIGLATAPDLPVSREEYLAGRFRRFGSANPERMELPFWKAMVRCGWDAYRAAKQFDDESYDRGTPVWCFARNGMSLTPLPDGRFIQIAGEHEDHYDPDFCIYNEVLIHDGKGGFEILGYPEAVFPPTDFHSATLVGDWIYIIGNLGYPADRDDEATPVYRLNVGTGGIEKVATGGQSAGWIHRHRAELMAGGRIRITGGKRWMGGEIVENRGSFELDLMTGTWTEA